VPITTPEVERLLREAFRRVAIPYSGVFASLQADTVTRILRYGLADDAIARKTVVKSRLQGSALGKWVCPRRALPESPTTAGRSKHSLGTLLHAEPLDRPGLCPVLDEKTGQPCNTQLRAQDTHLDELAAAFGFLEETRGGYIRGRFGLVAEYVQTLQTPGRYFDAERAMKALFLYTLLERHGDFVLPALLSTLETTVEDPNAAFTARVRQNLNKKLRRLRDSDLPRSAAFHALLSVLTRHSSEWAVETAALWPVNSRRSPSQLAHAGISDKTLSSYLPRTISYLADLGYAQRQAGPASRVYLTTSGERLIGAVESGMQIRLSDATELPPSFEAVHDAFSLDWARYLRVFTPAVTQARLEATVTAAILPDRPVVSWKRDEVDLQYVYRGIVEKLGTRLSNAARIDVVRLALFIRSIGTGVPLRMIGDDPASEGDPNDNAAVRIPLGDPKHYLLGHARTGRRFWTVALLRK
jgi:hypothetical protein